MQKHEILIIGGGNAGISVAAQLMRKNPRLDIAIIEPSEYHYYQPAWTLVGGGVFNQKATRRSEASVIPIGVKWIRDKVKTLVPDKNEIVTDSGTVFSYDYLVAAPGIQLDFSAVAGLEETLGKNGVCTNYRYDSAPYTLECMKQLKPGDVAIFTSPGTPVKCGGAPQKMTYLTADYLRNKKILKEVGVEFCTAGGVLFGIKKYADELMKMVHFYGIKLRLKHDLVAVDGPNHTARFKVTDEQGNVSYIEKKFNMLGVTPPQSAPDFIKKSPLADEKGWISVDKHSLQHTKFPNVFALGDATNTPNSKTGAAVRKQAPVLVSNLLSSMAGKPLTAHYSGYGSCPLVVGYGKLILAEFDYTNTPTETFPFNQAKPRWSMWILKKYILPWLYWNRILTGKM
ncbi:MAG: NAD(P)/FAD-dependent oxidoreductase [Bacteroidetes bacterium]|nr:NAD(P)/FAD-dependent oxidoreductase [Bacteroidota bacterium]